MNKKGQTTIFIIGAIIIIAAAVIIFLLYPKINPPKLEDETNPKIYIAKCVENEMATVLDKISKQGGSLSPEHYILYGGNKVGYLCYTNKYYETCSNQQPLLKENIQKEIENYIKPKAEKCVGDFVANIKKKGYSVSNDGVEVSVEIIPNNLIVNVNAPMTISKNSQKTYDIFRVVEKSRLYTLIMISTSILNWEAKYGDADPNSYMLLYPSIQIEKFKQTEGTSIYKLTDRNNLDEFIFASRSGVFPAGYGFSQT